MSDAVLIAARQFLDAIDDLRQFEKDHPNDSTKRWDAVFYAKNDAEEVLRNAVIAAEKVV